MKIERNDDVPENRAMFERNAYVVVELGIGGKLHLRESMTNHGLDKVRTLPNGRIDLHSINESARVIMNMAACREFMEGNEKTKQK